MARDSNAHTVSIVSATSLSSLASSMAVGWAQLNASNLNVLGSVGSQGGVGGNMIPYSNQAVWDPTTNAIRFMGSDHHGGSPSFGTVEIQYLESTNSWSVVDPFATPGSHGYGHNAIRPDTGDFYFRLLGGGSIPQPARRKLVGGSWSTFATSPTVYTQVGVGSAYWPGSNSGVLGLSGKGAGGCWIIVEIALGSLVIFDPVAGTWEALSVPQTLPTTDVYHTVAAYSKVHNCVVYGGGSNGGNQGTAKWLWRLNQDKTVTRLADSPINVGVQQANLAVDPITGNFLIWGGENSARQLWELKPTGSGVYTQQTGSRQPPPAGGNGVSDPNGGAGGPDALISCELPNHGVVSYMSASGASYANMFLYKHVNGFSTTFPLTENPLSEGSKWTGGATGQWQNMRTSMGKVFGTGFTGGSGGGSEFDDNLAVLKTSVRTFAANQAAQGITFRQSGYLAGNNHEIELLLRFTITPTSATGYEILWSHDGWLVIVRWNGPLGNYTELASTGAPISGNAAHGDVIRGEIIGNTIRAYKNNTLILTATDSTYSTGQPGVGAWIRAGGTTIENFCWRAFSAWDL